MTDDAMTILEERQHLGIRLGLDRVLYLLGVLDALAMGHVIHVAGTKGKGSTVEFLRRLLLADGRTVGVFSSPFVRDPREQVQIGDAPVSAERLAEVIDRLRPRADEVGATAFEMLTAAAFHSFADAGVEFSIVEVGVGGRDDATNALPATALSILTPIGLDHQEFLGETIEEIAAHKAGILRPGTPGVVAVTDLRAREVIENHAAEIGAPLHDVDWRREFGETFAVSTPLRTLAGLASALHGSFQQANAATAITAADVLFDRLGLPPISEAAIRLGLSHAYLPGRYEVLRDFPRRVIADGAHNPLSAAALAAALSEESTLREGRSRLILVVGMRANHDPIAFLQPFAALHPAGLVATQPSTNRPTGGITSAIHTAEEIAAASGQIGIPVWGTVASATDAVQYALARMAPDDTVCVCGSFTTVGDIDPLALVE